MVTTLVAGFSHKTFSMVKAVAFWTTVLNLAMVMTMVGYSLVVAHKVYRVFRPVQVQVRANGPLMCISCFEARSETPIAS